MTEEANSPTGPRQQRARLSAELRRLRRLSGLSGREIASSLGVGQATISRFENGQAIPSLPQITAWCKAVRASSEQRSVLVGLTEAALNEVETWRMRLREGLSALQTDVSAQEATARVHRSFQPAVVPGLLQTAEYARRVFELVDVIGGGDYASAVAERLARQQVLYEEGHQFEFVMTEAALRLGIVPRRVMAAQLVHIANVASLDNVDIRVVPVDAETTVIPWCGFTIYDGRGDLGPFARIELPHGGTTANDPDDVAIYRRQHAQAREAAIPFDEYRRLTQSEA